MTYFLFERAVATPGHKYIQVLCNDDGTFPKEDQLVQCSTIDRIPFKMKRKDIEARYKRAAAA